MTLTTIERSQFLLGILLDTNDVRTAGTDTARRHFQCELEYAGKLLSDLYSGQHLGGFRLRLRLHLREHHQAGVAEQFLGM
jgi:hypothetical protein